MPVQKENATKLRKFGYNFESIPRQVVEQITNPVALAYYTYLLTRPDDWVVRRSHLMDHFGVGRDRHGAAMKQLREIGVVWFQDERNAKGQILERLLMIGAIPVDDLPKVGKPTIRGSQPESKTDHLKNNRVSTEKHKGLGDVPECVDSSTWGEWLEYRKEIKKRMTPSTVKRQGAFLAKHDHDTQKLIIDQSIRNGWTGLFDLKESNNGHAQKTTGPGRNPRRLSPSERVRAKAAQRAAERDGSFGCTVDGYGRVVE
jgi:hypothetical protein